MLRVENQHEPYHDVSTVLKRRPQAGKKNMPGQFLYCQIVSRKRPVSNDARIGLSYTAEKEPFRPFLTQSDSASRKRPFSTRIFFDWILLVLLIVSQVDFIVFVLFLEAVGVREYCCCTAVWQSKIGWQLCASRVPREQRVLRAR